MNKLSIVIPCFNEAANISLMIKSFKEAVDDQSNVEIIFVNNGSSDNSEIIFQNELKHLADARFKLVNVKNNIGYGNGILKGLESATGNILSWTHADLQTDPIDVIKAFEIFNGKNSDNIFIKGKRIKRKLIEAIFTFCMQLISWICLKTYLDDINAQPKMFTRKFYSEYIVNKAPLDFSLDLYALFMAKKSNVEIITFPVFFRKRHAGEAKGGGSWKTRIKLIKRTFKYILNLKREMRLN